jgi:dienelactone hydrolase
MYPILIGCLMFLCASALAAQASSAPDEPWSLTREIEIVSQWPNGERLGKDRIIGDLYRPRSHGRVPAAVIINSSGGVSALTELYYARTLVKHGMATLVVDSFRPRGVRRTGDDQGRVSQEKSNADAIAGYRWLATQDWVDASRIIVLGMSRGGETAYSAALQGLRQRLGAADVRFAAHVSIAPGGCNFQQRDVRTTGAPMFFMLAELDEANLVPTCIDYIQRMRAAGNPNIRLAVYPGVHHAYEGTAGIGFAAKDWISRDCAGRFLRDEQRLLYDRASGGRATQGAENDFLIRTCLQRGYTVGGDDRVKAQATADLLQFLRDSEVLRDEEARAVVPDCATVSEGIYRRNCIRARNGWTGDLVALARALRVGAGPQRDDAAIARLLELAAARGNSHAQWELAIMLRQGVGATQDHSRALGLARAAAEAGDAAGLNVYGVMIRDGIGRASDDTEAAIWFQRAADLRNSYGMTNLARFMWEGRGGLRLDRSAAVALWRRAVYQDENPWAQLFLAEALTLGEGVVADKAEALRLLLVIMNQDREPLAKARAAKALSRLQNGRG